ncbi:MAG: tetratricopeptide repeat protein [Candidatus Omnitrophica bacterium]|nr:tetratricopeptide repeat protein [Candidatus Omnitrophota bacterium]
MKQLFKKYILPFFALLAMGLACYSNAFCSGFLMDDYAYILGNSTATDFSIKGAFTQSVDHFYRPMCVLLSRGAWILFQKDPTGYHIFNFLIFILAGYLFFILWRRLLGNAPLAFLASCLYLVHPINNLLVNYKTASCLTFSVLTAQAGIMAFLNFWDGRRIAWYLVSMVLFFCSLFFHEVNFLVPVYLFLILYFLKGYSGGRALKICLPFAVPLLMFLVIRINIPGAMPGANPFYPPIWVSQYISTLVALIKWYLLRLVVPAGILIERNEGIHAHLNWGTLGIIALAVFVITVLFVRWKKSSKSLFLALFLIGFPHLYFLSFLYVASTYTGLIEPHWFLFPSIGFFLLAASGLLALKKRIRSVVWIAFVVCLFLALGVLTRQANEPWKTQVTYARYWIKLNPANKMAWYELARAILDAGKGAEDPVTLKSFDSFLKEKKNPLAYGKRAVAYVAIGRYDLALSDYNEALKFELGPYAAEIYNGRGSVYAFKKEYDSALVEYNHAIALNPFFAKAYSNRGVVYGKRKQYDLEIADYNRAIKFDPGADYAYYNRALAFEANNEHEKAYEDLVKAKALGQHINDAWIKAFKNHMIVPPGHPNP